MSEIKVVPCPTTPKRWRITVDGKFLKKENGYWWRGSQAEALEKAAELRTIEENKQWASEGSRPVETRPPALLAEGEQRCAECGQPFTMAHGQPLHTTIAADHKARATSDPAEQAAPPRPLTEFTQDDILAACKWRILCQNPQLNLDPVESPVDAILKRLAAPAAIEQARPPIRTHIVDAMGKCLPDCSGCTVRLFDGTIVGEQARPQPPTRVRKGSYVCSNCGNTEEVEREITCWKCGKGEMIYHAAAAEPAPTPSRPLKRGDNCIIRGTVVGIHSVDADWSPTCEKVLEVMVSDQLTLWLRERNVAAEASSLVTKEEHE
jgi:hypothetical protein